MKITKRLAVLGFALLLMSCSGQEKTVYQVPVEYHKLENGLRVVLSPDHTAPIVTVAVYYNIGFRIEPRDRTGFAHLFEHMMFQGSENLGKMEFIRLVQSNGGILNGSTRFDYTNYFEIVPSHKLETMLWAEADRMRSLAITQENLTNQQGVVTNEVKVNVHNQPYGGFPWLDMPQIANENWYNAHNFYGELADIQAATLEDVQSFFDQYYAPNNAAVVIVGDFEPADALNLVEQYFGDIEPSDPISFPDVSEPRQEQEKRESKVDTLASRPALAVAYHMPKRLTPEYYAMGLLDQILLQGEDSQFYQTLVQENGYTGDISGGINAYLGNMYNYNGPILWMMSLIHDAETPVDSIIAKIDARIKAIQNGEIDQAMLDQALVKIRSSFYDILGSYYGFGRADLLASFALFDDHPDYINEIEGEFEQVTPERVQRTAQEYLRTGNRTILTIIAKDKPSL
jgi:predicted Zn-dependent peptidase